MRRLLSLSWIVLLVVAGCLGGPGRNPSGGSEPSTTTAPVTQPPGLESVLFQLVSADDRETFARERGLELRDGRVLVVVELRAGRTFPADEQADVRRRFDGEVQAYLPIDRLVPLAEHGNVSFVRADRPVDPDADQ